MCVSGSIVPEQVVRRSMKMRKANANRRQLWVGLFFFLAASSNELDYASANPRVPGRFDFSPVKLQKLKKSALAGDRDAALQVAYFELFARSKFEDENIYWEQIAAENGSADAMKILAATLRLKGGRENCSRAIYWAKRAGRESKDGELKTEMKYFLDELSGSAPCKGIFD
jgi:hypothetical protein